MTTYRLIAFAVFMSAAALVPDKVSAMYMAELGRFVSRDPMGYDGSPWNLYEYAAGNPVIHTDSSGMQLDSVSQAVKKCMSLPTPALRIKCLQDLSGTGNPALEKARKIALCKMIHTGYKSLNCKGCKGVCDKKVAQERASCLAAEVSGRSMYLREKCDYFLPGSIKRGSKLAEKNHRIELQNKMRAMYRCIGIAAGL